MLQKNFWILWFQQIITHEEDHHTTIKSFSLQAVMELFRHIVATQKKNPGNVTCGQLIHKPRKQGMSAVPHR
jgi:hypothetical protein